MIKSILITTGVLITIGATMSLTICKSTDNMRDIYGIQNVATGKGLRPYNAYWWVGNRLVLYDYRNWKCMTWQMTSIGENTFQLRNLSTGKTFCTTADSPDGKGKGLKQQRLKPEAIRQHWEFLKQPDQTYLIRQKGTQLYLTAISDQTNSNIVLESNQHSDMQKWRLIEQHPRQ